MPEEYLQQLMPWVKDYYEGQLYYNNGTPRLLQEVIITASGRPEDKMRANLQNSIEQRKAKDIKDNYTIHRNMNQAQNNVSKILFPLVTAPALTVLPWASIGKGLAKGLEFTGHMMSPSSYTGIFGTGAYTTSLGGSTASLGGALADAGLASYFGLQAYKAVKNNPNLGTVTNAALATLPMAAVLERPALVTSKLTLPFKHKYSNKSGKLWLKSDVLNYLSDKRSRPLTNAEIEDFMRSNGLTISDTPLGEAFLETEEGSIAKGIDDLLNFKTPLLTQIRRINTLEDLDMTPSIAGRNGLTLDTRVNTPYRTEDLFTSNGELRGGQEAFFNMRPLLSGSHGKANWRMDSPERQASAILRTHFNGNPGETAVDAYTGLTVLNPDGTVKIFSPIKAIMTENPSLVSGVQTNIVDGEYSIDSYRILLAKLRAAYNKGMRFKRTRYNSWDHKLGKVNYLDFVGLNEYSTKTRFNTDNLSNEFKSLLRQYYKDSFNSTKPLELPEGTTIKRDNNGLQVFYNGKSQGYIVENPMENIIKTLIDEIDETNKVLKLTGKDKIAYPTFDNKVLRVANPQFVIYNKGGKFKQKKHGLFNIRFNKSNFNV